MKYISMIQAYILNFLGFKSIFRSALIGGVVFLVGAGVGAASFDCARASGSTEKLICLDYRLSDMDSDLAGIYESERLRSLGNSSLQARQRAWIAERNRCTSFACVRDLYRSRISELSPSVGRKYSSAMTDSSKKWDYSAPPGNILTRLFSWGGRVMAEQSSLATEGGWRWVFLDDGVVINREFTGRSPEYFPSLVVNESLKVGSEVSISNAGSSMCRTGVGEQGLRVEGRVGFNGKKSVRILVALVRGKWIDSEASPDCFEVELKYRRANFIHAGVFENSFYWQDEGFVLRFDDSLWTHSSLVGEKVVLVWGEELSKMVTPYCEIYDRACVDKRLLKLLSEISYFYK